MQSTETFWNKTALAPNSPYRARITPARRGWGARPAKPAREPAQRHLCSFSLMTEIPGDPRLDCLGTGRNPAKSGRRTAKNDSDRRQPTVCRGVYRGCEAVKSENGALKLPIPFRSVEDSCICSGRCDAAFVGVIRHPCARFGRSSRDGFAYMPLMDRIGRHENFN